MAGPTVVVEAPPRAPRLGGIKAVATVLGEQRLAVAEGIIYQSDGCTFPQPAVGLCYEANPPVDAKTYVGITNQEAVVPPFSLYAGVACYLGPDTDYTERANAILDQGEDRVLETRLEDWADGGTALATSTNLAAAIAKVEDAADANYLGQPVIVMNRGDAVLAASQNALWYGIDGVPMTINGNRVLASSSFPAGTVYALGSIVVIKDFLGNFEAQELEHNRLWAIGEAVYTILVDCAYSVRSALA
jgi:hypothetical protein